MILHFGALHFGALHFGGRHAAFVWAAYALTAPVIVGLAAESLLRARRWRREVERLEARRDGAGGAP